MSNPTLVLFWMASFLAGVVFLCVLVLQRLLEIFAANPFFNGVILSVLLAGIAVNYHEVRVLAGEIEWMNGLRTPGKKHSAPKSRLRLLGATARLLGDSNRSISLSASAMRALLDGVQSRLDESRSLSRYFIGLAIFLGLLGTFWGLLVTIRSVTDIIGALNVGEDAVTTFVTLKDNLRQPLAGMATSFSTSLFGLASSLIIGFLDLQAGHAQNRFYNQLEEWLSSQAHLSRTAVGLDSEGSSTAYLHTLLIQTAEGLEQMQQAIMEHERTQREGLRKNDVFASQLIRLNDLLDQTLHEQQTHRLVQEELKTALRLLVDMGKQEQIWPDELRAEIRVLTRTLALALESRHTRT